MANLSNPIVVTFVQTVRNKQGASEWVETYRLNKLFARTRSGVSNPKWKEKIRRGESATTAFSGVLQSLRTEVPCKLLLLEIYVPTGAVNQRIEVTGQSGVEFGGVSGSSTAADNQALKFLYRAIKDRRTSFQGGVFLGEMREALRMISSPAKALREGINHYFRDVRKRIPKGSRPKHQSKILAETWLENQFGWQPLVSDIHAGVQAYLKHSEKLVTSRITRVGNETSYTVFQANAAGSNFHGVPTLIDRNNLVTTSVMYRVGLRMAGQGASPDVSVFERAGLTLREFVPTIWELTPWSFLVDYFTNIGDILEAGCVNTSDVIWASKTVRSQAVFTRHEKPDSSAGSSNPTYVRTITGSPGTCVTVNKTVTRSIPVLGYPKFQVSVPGISTKWINMGALVASSRRG